MMAKAHEVRRSSVGLAAAAVDSKRVERRNNHDNRNSSSRSNSNYNSNYNNDNTYNLLVISSFLLIVMMSAHALELVAARYIHPTYKFASTSSPLYSDDADDRQQTEDPRRQALSRRQDFDGDDEEGDADGDQSAAASYQNQDDVGGAKDGYEDNEPDGPYEETPVEQEGQADLERFFDDHLGASDREGMDKENLPTNLVASISRPPPHPDDVNRPESALPGERPNQASSEKSTIIHPLGDLVDPPDPYQMVLPTIRTSFIRLPDEKMLITHQVTARNTNRMRAPIKLPHDDKDQESISPERFPAAAAAAFIDSRSSADDGADHEAQRSRSSLVGPYGGDKQQLQGNPSPSSSPSVRQQQQQQQQPQQQQQQQQQRRHDTMLSAAKSDASPEAGAATRDSLAARGSEVVATEDDDYDLVYVTNSTNKPFRIEALGGYDPEEDFIDAAKELEVLASDRAPNRGEQQRAPESNDERRRLRPRPRQPLQGAPARGYGRQGGSVASGQLDDDEAASSSAPNRRRHQKHETDFIYEDASEPDEVTFGQDDPYQTDLEAEIRQQEYDKLAGKPSFASAAAAAVAAAVDQPDPNDGSNVAVDNGEPAQASEGAGREADEDNDIDRDVDNEYSSEPKVHTAPQFKSANTNRRRDEPDDEGGWVNDGVDEMDIPSQSHQNLVLKKAAQRDRAAAEAEAAAAIQQPDGESTLSGQTSDDGDDGDDGQRMPNSNYLGNDLMEDDSGYAA